MAYKQEKDPKVDMPIRAFVAFHLPESVRERLRSVQGDLKGGRFPVKWVRPDSIHLTLKFLGDIHPSAVEAVAAAAEAAAASAAPISLSAKGLGVFPGARNPRVVWAGLSGDTHDLIRFQQRFDTILAEAGFAPEKRPFKAHLTIGRIKGRVEPGEFLEALRTAGGFAPVAFCADRLVLYRSQLRPAGAVYTELSSAGLGGTSGTQDRMDS